MPTLLTLGKDVITNVNPVYWSVKEISAATATTKPAHPKATLRRVRKSLLR